MLAAFHRDLIAAPFLGDRPLVQQTSDYITRVILQKNLREHAAGIAAASGFSLRQKLHLDDHGLAIAWTGDHAHISRLAGVPI